ncbi:histone acetylase complex subunit [Microsporum canis CBS 113480]|uniref:Chromatin modification-related protein EAF3 n=1 Tax=Arthroderma otae (strain ATCC MYA-4605 / CBS 113480) TaxID=554155 RepID=C5FUN5_ARTOC|nr:histone acetylase complex subunit [Microsporum canis CBS 113480]EEQ33619.1 histone acetylase complex subunit [Microsporum canis CBS 113480]
MPLNHPIYHKDETVLCFHHDILYEAKIIALRLSDPEDRKSPYEYRVHYKGWKHTWDDWVFQDRLRKATEDNKELAATLRREAEAASRKKSKKKKPAASDPGSNIGSDDRQSSIPARGTKRGRDTEIEKEDEFNARPSIRIVIPDNLKALLVDDWEYVTKNNQLVPLPAKAPVSTILDQYFEEEKPKRASPSDVDVLEEVVAGIREYFEKSLSKILLYQFERQQYQIITSLPELIAQTGLSQQATQRLREELSKFSMWLSKHSERYFSAKYDSPSKEYIDKAKGVNSQDVPGTVTARLFEMDKQEKSD